MGGIAGARAAGLRGNAAELRCVASAYCTSPTRSPINGRPQETGDGIWSSDFHAVVQATVYERYCIVQDCQIWNGRCRTKVSVMLRIVQKRQPEEVQVNALQERIRCDCIWLCRQWGSLTRWLHQ